MNNFLCYCVTNRGRFAANLFDGTQRLFDVALNDYSGQDFRSYPAEYFFNRKGHKWPSIAALLPTISRKYQAYCFLDDDVVINAADINHLFQEGIRLGFNLWQASLTWDSYEYWKFLYTQGWGIREVPLVEVMMPFFSAEALRICLPSCAEFESGHALDQLWAQMLNWQKMVVFDQVQATHRRYPRSIYWKLSSGLTVFEEARMLREKYCLLT